MLSSHSARSLVIQFVSDVGFEYVVFKNEWRTSELNATLGECSSSAKSITDFTK